MEKHDLLLYLQDVTSLLLQARPLLEAGCCGSRRLLVRWDAQSISRAHLSDVPDVCVDPIGVGADGAPY